MNKTMSIYDPCPKCGIKHKHPTCPTPLTSERPSDAATCSVLPERLQGEKGMVSLLTECRNVLDPQLNVSLIADIEKILTQNSQADRPQGSV